MSKKVPPTPPTGPTDPEGAEKIGVPLHAAESIVKLHVVATEHMLGLPSKNTFVVGAGDVDVRVPVIGDTRMVSRRHAELTREGNEDGTWLRVVDLNSTHGTYFKNARDRNFPVRAGERFRLADTELLVMDRSLVKLREDVAGFFGFTRHQVVDDHLALLRESDLGQNDPILLLGDVGSERGHLAHAIHQQSLRRSLPFHEIKDPATGYDALQRDFEGAKNGIIYVALDNLGSRAPLGSLNRLLFDPQYNVRPIIAARDLREVCGALTATAKQFKHLTVPKVRDRPEDIPALLDMMMDEGGSRHRVVELRPDRLAAMCAFHWPKNRADLRATAKRLAAHLAHPRNLSEAARSIKSGGENFRVALVRVGAITVDHRDG